jgi:hypothetical protein
MTQADSVHSTPPVDTSAIHAATIVQLSDYRAPPLKKGKAEIPIRALSVAVFQSQGTLHLGRKTDRQLRRRLRNGEGLRY